MGIWPAQDESRLYRGGLGPLKHLAERGIHIMTEPYIWLQPFEHVRQFLAGDGAHGASTVDVAVRAHPVVEAAVPPDRHVLVSDVMALAVSRKRMMRAFGGHLLPLPDASLNYLLGDGGGLAQSHLPRLGPVFFCPHVMLVA